MDGDDSIGGECLSVPLVIKTRKGPRRERQKACEGTAACEQRKEKVAGDKGVARRLLCHHIEKKSRQARSNNNSNEVPTGGRVPRKACLDEERATVFFVTFAVSVLEPSQPDEPGCG